MGTTVPTLTEGQTRGLKPHLPEVTTEIRQSVAAGVEPQEAVERAVAHAQHPVPDETSIDPVVLGRDVIRVVGGLVSLSASEILAPGPMDKAVRRLLRVAEWIRGIPGMSDHPVLEALDEAVERYEEAAP